MSYDQDTLQALALDAVDRSLKAGADHAEAYVRFGSEAEIAVRDQEIETLQEGNPKSIGLRLWRGERAASTYTTDFSDAAIDRLITDSLELASLTDPIPEASLPERVRYEEAYSDLALELFDPDARAFSAEDKLKLIRTAEETALAFDPRITVSGGASYGDLVMTHALANSQGFARSYRSSYVSYHTTMIADDADGKKRRGYWYSMARHLEDLLDAEAVGRVAAERTLKQLGAGPIETGSMPVVFDPLAGTALLGLLFSVITGRAIETGNSYLVGALDTAIASSLVTLIDDPLRVRGLGSRPYDGEGLPVAATTFVDEGTLRSYALNTYNARKLGMKATGHASRPASGAPGETASNLYMAAGALPREELFAGIKRGFYCESMMGFGFTAATGDFSRGASGYLIENGKLTRPVSEVTISANFRDLFAAIDAVGDDLTFLRSVNAPTFRVAEMMVAGSAGAS